MSYVFDYISEINTNNTIALNNYIKSIKNLTANDVLTININSTGGSVSEGIAAYNIIKQLPCKVVTHNLGEVSSAAILLYMAGNIRTASDISKFLIHPVKMGINENCNYYRLKELYANLEADINRYFSVLITEIPNITQIYDIENFLKHDSLVLSKKEAISCGMVTMP